jgi:hypothetical protein
LWPSGAQAARKPPPLGLPAFVNGTRSEIHESLARAFERAGEADSAAAHYRAVADAWRRADPSLRARAVAAGQRAFELGEGVRSKRVTNGTAIALSQRAEP